MIDNEKFNRTKDYILNGIQPSGDVYTLKEFRKLVRYKIKYQIIKNKQQKYMRNKALRKIKKDILRLERLEKENGKL